MRFVIYEDEAGEWRWRLKASNGRIVADSAEGYARKRNAVRAVESLQGVLGLAHSSWLFDDDNPAALNPKSATAWIVTEVVD